MKTVCCIPIKLNNERLPGKNTKLLGEKPLISYILSTVGKVSSINETYVYCSDERIKEYLPDASMFLRRDKKLDEPNANFSQIFESFRREKKADVYVYTHATAPFIEAETIEECIASVIEASYDSAFSATEIQDFLWQDGKPVNFDPANISRSQDLKAVYRETSGVYVFNAEVFDKLHRRVGVNPYIKKVGFKEAVDINTPQDFELAEALLNYRGD